MDIGLKVVLICAGFMAICVVLGMIGKKLAEQIPTGNAISSENQKGCRSGGSLSAFPGRRNRVFFRPLSPPRRP